MNTHSSPAVQHGRCRRFCSPALVLQPFPSLLPAPSATLDIRQTQDFIYTVFVDCWGQIVVIISVWECNVTYIRPGHVWLKDMRTLEWSWFERSGACDCAAEERTERGMEWRKIIFKYINKMKIKIIFSLRSCLYKLNNSSFSFCFCLISFSIFLIRDVRLVRRIFPEWKVTLHLLLIPWLVPIHRSAIRLKPLAKALEENWMIESDYEWLSIGAGRILREPSGSIILQRDLWAVCSTSPPHRPASSWLESFQEENN